MGVFGIAMTLFTALFLVAFVAVVVAVIVGATKQARSAVKNRNAPEVSAVARVLAKRIETSGGGDRLITQRHFVTFEQPGGERFELEIDAADYGMLVEGDQGTVAMKGNRYLGFTRELLR